MVVGGDYVNSALYYVLCSICLPIVLFTMYILVFKSPTVLRTYRNTLLNMTALYLLAVASFGLFLQPTYGEVGPSYCIKLNGLVNYFGVAGVYVFGPMATVSIMNTGTSIVLCFFYRYLALAYPQLLERMSSLRMIFFGMVIYVIGNAILAPFGIIFLLTAKLMELDGFYHFCVNPDQFHLMGAIIAVLLVYLSIHGVIIVVLLVLSLRNLRLRKSAMCAKTYQLQRMMTRSLVVLATLPIVIDVIPIIAAGIALFINCGHIYEITSIVSHVPFVEVVLVCVFTIVFVTPYRNAAYDIFSQLRKKCGSPVCSRLYRDRTESVCVF